MSQQSSDGQAEQQTITAPYDYHLVSDETVQGQLAAVPEDPDPDQQSQLKTSSDRPNNSSDFKVFLFGWKKEILALILSFACLIGMIVVLNHFNGRPQPQWPRYITLNSLLSWLTTLFTTSLLVPVAACFGQATWLRFRSASRPLMDIAKYDAASRGPPGSLELLWYLKARHLASIGAIVTVLSLGVDPMMQQTLSIGLTLVNSTESVTLGRAQSYIQADPKDDTKSTGTSVASVAYLPPDMMVTALLDGMFYRGSGSDLGSVKSILSCPTGNCTFPSFQTLAINSECRDITSMMTEICNSTLVPGEQDPQSTKGHCIYSLPNGLVLDKKFGPTRAITDGGRMLPVLTPRYPQTISNFTIISSGAPVTSLGSADLSVAGNKSELDPDKVTQAFKEALSTKDTTAMQCSLYWGVQTIHAAVLNGLISETVTDWWYNTTSPQIDLGPDFHTLDQTGSGAPDTSTVDPGYGANAIWTLRPPPPNPNDSAFDFVVSKYASYALSKWLANHLTVSAQNTVYSSQVMFGCNKHSSDTTGSDTIGSAIDQCRQFDIERLLIEANITAMFEKLAISMSTTLRKSTLEFQKGGSMNVPGVGPAHGFASTREVLVLVRWLWIIFPFAIFSLAMLFFALIAISTSHHQLEIWKTSPFPLIFSQVDESDTVSTFRLTSPSSQSKVGAVEKAEVVAMPLSGSKTSTIPGLERRAKDISGRLENWNTGFRFTTSKAYSKLN